MTTTAPASLLDSYASPDGSYDELRGPGGAIRKQWAPLAKALDALGSVELGRRSREAARLLRNDGVTYNIYDPSDPSDTGPSGAHGPSALSTPWALDPVPMLIGNDEWTEIERGVVQRAELFDLILADLYGPRDLLRRGVLPLELVYGHRGFLRQADQIRLPGPHQLIVYAADLARDAQGRPSVIADFAQAPSGAGYALENRVVTSRVLPALYRDSQVKRLAPFFRTLRASLAAVAPNGIDSPRVVVLTPGTFNESYFEHAYLARYLGYSLVEGTDLIMRDGRVWLRALGGLDPVDVILRRVDGWYSDPLELRSDSRLGVPGLVEASRRGTVSVVNGVGASVLENVGIMPFLPRLARELLGQDLLLPSTTTWWCGNPAERSHVLANLRDLVVKPIARKAGRNAMYGWSLSADQIDDVRRRIEARPHLYVAQERVAFSTAPCVRDASSAPGDPRDRRGSSALEARHAMLRAFAVASDDSFVAMPGGLTRVSATPDDQFVSAQLGGLSKDTWVLAPEPERQTGYWLHAGPSVSVIDPAGSMPSRAAENLYWLGRYAERAEGTVRLVRAILDRAGDFTAGTDHAGTECLHALLMALTHLSAGYPGFVGDGAEARREHPEDELIAVVLDRSRRGSIASVLGSMFTAANSVRDQLSNDTWLATSAIEHELATLARAVDDSPFDAAAALQPMLATVMRNLLALAGIASESMVRDPGWRFMDAGRRVERAALLATLLDATLVPVRTTASDSMLLESVLISVESIITYRRRYRSQAQLATVLDLMLVDPTNPRSLAFQIDRLGADVAEFPRDARPRLSEEEQLVLQLSTRLRVIDTEQLSSVNSDGRREELASFLATVRETLARTSNTIDANHFTHLAPSRVLVAGQADSTSTTLGGSMP